jgi:uncharacterized SAM-binding protein YcdF (DUF218 family)
VRAATEAEGRGRPPAGRRRRVIGWALAILGAVFAVVLVWLYVQVRLGARHQPTGAADALIVLGSSVRAGDVSPVYKARLDRAIELYNEGYAKHIIPSGPHRVGTLGRDYLIKQGVPPEAVVAETAAEDTWENVVFSKAVMDEHGWRTAIVVSCPFHLYRSLWLCRRAGLPAEAAGSDSPIEHDIVDKGRWSVLEVCKMLGFAALHIGRSELPTPPTGDGDDYCETCDLEQAEAEGGPHAAPTDEAPAADPAPD